MAEGAQIIVVTGGAGFVGSHLCHRLAGKGNRVISLDNYFAGSEKNHVAGVEYRRGHTKDIAALIPEKPDIIYHLGEYARVEQSLLEPDIVYDLNTLGTRGVVDFWGTHNLPYAITYFYNVYGPGERAGAYGTVIEMFKQMYLRGAPITVTSPGTQMRNFTHVDDIVAGLLLVGEKGHGDEYGLGNEKPFSMLEVARLFGTDIMMLPERAGNRMKSDLVTTKSRALGWESNHKLEDYVYEFLRENAQGAKLERRVLVFSTTFHPVSGPAENALVELITKMPEVQFDIVTTAFSKTAQDAGSPVPNATIHRVGSGRPFDKYLLPGLGDRKARVLHRKHTYLFAWSLLASYAALASILLKRITGLPLLITLADQDLSDIPFLKRKFLKLILTDADQVYGAHLEQEKHASRYASRPVLRQSMGEGDAFANQLRFVYAEIIRENSMNA